MKDSNLDGEVRAGLRNEGEQCDPHPQCKVNGSAPS